MRPPATDQPAAETTGPPGPHPDDPPLPPAAQDPGLRPGVTRVLGSSSFRLAVLYMLLVAASVSVLLGFIYWSTAGYMDRQTDATIHAEIQGLAEQYRLRGLRGLTATIRERIARDPSGASTYLLVDEDLKPLIGNLDRWPGGFPDDDGWLHFRLRERGPDRSEEHAARAQVFGLRGDLRLLVGRDVRDLEETRTLILEALAWGLALTAALALVGGWVMTSRVLRRIEAIHQTSREIMEGDLARRIPLGGSGDDFDKLAAGLNRMLAQIESLMSGVRQVSDNIAHDLRTPLTRLRTKLELLRTEIAGALGEDHRATAAAEETIADADEMLTTFNALLRIARIESGGRRDAFATVDLAALARDVAELYEPVAAERDQSLDVIAPQATQVFGDRDLLFQAIGNLVDNAVKYTPPRGRLSLQVTRDRADAVIAVADNGPGIPEGLHDTVFRRFYRADNSRSTPGSGLGLSLVQAVVQLHGARIELKDNHPGLRVRMLLPLALPLPAGQASKDATADADAPESSLDPPPRPAGSSPISGVESPARTPRLQG